MNKTFIHKAVISLCFIYASPITLASDNIVSNVINDVANTTGRIITSILPENNNNNQRVTAGHARHHVSENAKFQTVHYSKNPSTKSVSVSKHKPNQIVKKSSDTQKTIIVKRTTQTNTTQNTTNNTIVQQPVKQASQTQTKPITTSSNESIPTNTTDFTVKNPVSR